MKRINSLLSAGVTLTSSGTAVAAPIPLDSAGYFPRFVRVVATGAGCFVKVGDIGVTAVSGDCMIQPLDGTVLNVRGCKAISAISVSGTSSVTVVPLEAGSWNYDQRTLDYNFTTLSAVPSTVTFTRGSSATYFGSDGLLKVQGYNLLTNSVWAGGTSGVEGSGAVAPTGWVFGFATGSVTFNSDSSIRFVATNQRPFVHFAFTASAVTYTTSAKITALGAATTVGAIIGIVAAGATIGALSYTVNGVSVASGAAVSAGDIVTSSTTVSVGGAIQCRFGLGCLANTTGDVTITNPQLEAGSTATQYSPTTTAANSAPRLDYDPATPAGVTGGELVTNGDFSNGSTGWTLASEWAVTNGQLVLTGTGALSTAGYVGTSGTIGKTYRITYTIVSISGGSGLTLQDALGGLIRTGISTAGTYTDNVVCLSVPTLFAFKRTGGAVNATIDNISVQEVTFAPRGLLVEEQRVNSVTQSQSFSTWLITSGSIPTPNTVVSPDGTSNAQLVVASGTPTILQSPTVTKTAAAQAWTGTIFVKKDAAGPTVFTVTVDDGTATNRGTVTFNLQTMAAGTAVTNTGTFTATASIDPVHVGNNWYRLGLTTTTDTGVSVRLRPFWTGTLNVSVWGAQLEQGSFPTSYIPTTTASATRSADSALMNGTNFSSWYNQTQGTFVVEFDTSAQSSADQFVLCTSVSGASSNRTQIIRRSGTSTLGCATVSGGAVSADISVSPLANGVAAKAAYAYALNNFNAALNGTLGTPDTSGALPAIDQNQIAIGSRWAVDTNQLNGHIRRLQFYPVALPSATLQTLTA